MADYHKAAFTLDPTVEIPPEAAPAIGVTLAQTGEAIKEASDEQLVVTLTVGAGNEPGEVEFEIVPEEELTEPFTVEWDFGDRHETGHDLVQRNVFAPGVYEVTATVLQVERPSFTLGATVVVPLDEPEPPPGA